MIDSCYFNSYGALKNNKARETHQNTGRFPTEHPPLQHPELEILPPSKLPDGSVGNAPENPVPAPRGGLTFPATFSIRDSGHCPQVEHPPPAPRERGKSQPGKDREPPRFPVPAPAPPVPQRSTAPGRTLPRPIQGRKIPAGFPDTRPRDCLRSGSAGQHLLMNSNISDTPTETLK